MKKLIQKIVKEFTLFFVPKRVVISRRHPAGIFLKATEIGNKKYITIAVTNRAVKDSPNAAVIHHVPAHEVVGIRKLTTPFQKWWYGQLLHKPCPHHAIKKLAN